MKKLINVKLIDEFFTGHEELKKELIEFFNGDIEKFVLWFKLPNPHLGNVSPVTMIMTDKEKRLREFIKNSLGKNKE